MYVAMTVAPKRRSVDSIKKITAHQHDNFDAWIYVLKLVLHAHIIGVNGK
jgi:hypothetical protein